MELQSQGCGLGFGVGTFPLSPVRKAPSHRGGLGFMTQVGVGTLHLQMRSPVRKGTVPSLEMGTPSKNMSTSSALRTSLAWGAAD